ncbi:uncharacterized protein FA14DRAFT_153898 [Meira miltonrushii]|uniref:Uncharacterized protein n=1 Tax=Meira miltonrushii TaxID=1280837 RepID=A0A316VM18_9BASI|nr:uncharacterized protein FA14DRAFT_153898 [Meira miltonrushii]PWN38577.1 hypothetical protein FA14DRAFT_153898 [Meira miltonrushii]
MKAFKHICTPLIIAFCAVAFVRGSSSSSSESSSSDTGSDSNSGSKTSSGSSSRSTSDSGPGSQSHVSSWLASDLNTGTNKHEIPLPQANVDKNAKLKDAQKAKKSKYNKIYREEQKRLNPYFHRDASRIFRERHRNDEDYKEKRRAEGRAYRQKKLQGNFKKAKAVPNTASREVQRERKQEQGGANVEGAISTAKRKRLDKDPEADHKRVRKGTVSVQQRPSSPQDKSSQRIANIQSHSERLYVSPTDDHQSINPAHPRGRNIIRLKLPPETLKKHFPQTDKGKD